MEDKNKERFENWATNRGYSLDPGSLENGKGGRTYADDRTHYALLGYNESYFSFQSEIYALKKSSAHVIADAVKLAVENEQARAIINELRVLIENALPVDRNAPIWEMVKEFNREYIKPNDEEIYALQAEIERLRKELSEKETV